MPREPDVKICVICGEDCSRRARTVDTKGRYYCRACHRRAAAEIRARHGAPPPPEHEDDSDPLLHVEHAVQEAVHPPEAGVEEAVPPETCPSCRGYLAPNARLCTDCGYDRELHRRIDTREILATRAPSRWLSFLTSPAGIAFLILVILGAILGAAARDALRGVWPW
jgi:hypothetical protein